MIIRCWYYDTSELQDKTLFAEGLSALPWEERRQNIERLHFEKDKRLHLGAGLVALHALREAGAQDLRFGYGENKKPFLAAHPDIHFNLSHSGTLAVCAVSDAPVGVDVERMRHVKWNVAKRFFHEKELAWLQNSPDPDLAFTRLWTRKESYLKLIGTGLSLPLQSFCTVPSAFDTPDVTSFCALPSACDAPDVTFIERETCGHRICVCAMSQNEPVAFFIKMRFNENY